jgi:hypothetical protein
MPEIRGWRSPRLAGFWLPLLVLAAFLQFGRQAFAEPSDAPSAASLRSSYERLGGKLQNNAFNRPLHLESKERSNELEGDIYALVAQPFSVVNGTLNDPSGKPTNWCEVLLLHLNVKYCRIGQNPQGNTLTLNLGRKMEQPLEDTHPVEFRYRVLASEKDYFATSLSAPHGPLSTRDYRIILEAIPADNNQTFIHLTYAYGFGMSGKMAMKGYLSTMGRGKIGFTQVGTRDGKPEYITGVRAVVERNAMRYYVAIDSYLNAVSARREERFEKALKACIDTLEQYATQLQEVNRTTYLQMKKNEYKRMQENK